MATVTAEGSLTQRREALERANAIRLQRAELKRRIKGLGRSGASLVAELIRTCDDEVATMRVHELLCCVRRLGAERVDDMLARARVGQGKRVHGLSHRQSAALVEALSNHAAGREWTRPRTRKSRPQKKHPAQETAPQDERPEEIFIDSGAPPRPTGPRCRRCGEHLRRKGTYLCGFCEAEEGQQVTDETGFACPRCEGSGEIQVGGESLNPRVGVRGPDPQCDDVVRCPECGGK